MEAFQFRDNRLWCENVSLRQVAEQFGTPLYVYSQQSLIDHTRWIEQSLANLDHLTTYAVKANANREILRLLASEGIGADVGSVGELYLALNAGFPPEKVTFSGVGKSDEEIEFALKSNILSLNVESKEELHVINHLARRFDMRARILLRVNFNIQPNTHPYITTSSRENKFGVDAARAEEILRQAMCLSNIEVLGIHSHIGSQIIQLESFTIAARMSVELIGKLRAQGIPITHLNFGGGFGVQYRDYVTHPLLPSETDNREDGITTVKLLESILPTLRESRCKIIIQPGRSIVAHAGVLLTKVLYRKKNKGKTFIIVDAGMNDLIRPSLYQSYHQIVPLEVTDRPYEIVDVVGPLCETGDFFALDRTLPHIQRGDYVAIMCAGAYGFVLSSNYNGRPRPAEVLIVDGRGARIIRERETVADL